MGGYPTTKKSMSLAALSEGMPGLTAACGQAMAEAAAVCLESRSHQPGVLLVCAGLVLEHLRVEWLPVDDQSWRTHADMQKKGGACAVAILVVKELTGMVVIERSKKGTGFDYRRGTKDYEGLPFEGTPRLEVSRVPKWNEKPDRLRG